jgi:predicted dehydrogenase
MTGPDGKPRVRSAAEELIRWRLWNRTSAGLMAELGTHQLDAAAIFIAAVHGGAMQQPLNIAAVCNRPVFPADREVEDHVVCLLEYPAPGYYDPEDAKGLRVLDRNKRIGVQYATVNGNGFGGYGEIVFGSKGAYILEKEKQGAFSPAGGGTSTVKTSAGGGPTLNTQASGAQGPVTKSKEATSLGFTEELEHWAWCIRNPARENQPRCDAKFALANAVIALTANVAAKKSERIEFKPAWFDIDSDATPESSKKA